MNLPAGFVLDQPNNGAVDQIINVESAGNRFARNPNSTATGPGQFIESTWLDMLSKNRPDLASLPRDQQLALRTNPELSRAMTQAYATQNAGTLTKAGFQADDANTYLAHFAGPQGAKNILSANPDMPVIRILGPRVVEANPFLANMTAGQLRQWAANKMQPNGVNVSVRQTPPEMQSGSLPNGFVLDKPDENIRFNDIWGNTATNNLPTMQRSPLDPEAQRIVERNLSSEDPTIARNARIEQHVKDGSGKAIAEAMRSHPITAALSTVMPPEKILQGMTAGFSDEALAYIKSTLGQGAYDEILAAQKERLQRISNDQPVASLAGEVTGALLTAPATPAVNVFRGANIASRAVNAAATGAVYGGIYGAGSADPGLENRVQGAASGAVTGAITGGIASPVAEGVVAAARTVARPFRGAMNPQAEAERRIAEAIRRDNPNMPNAVNQAADVLENANAQGVPMVVGDLGGGRMRALARSASDTSPDARALLQNVVDDRFEGQGQRISNVVRSVIGGNPDAPAVREQLRTAARSVNAPAYRQAYARGQNLWDETLQGLAQAPDMQTAIRAATVRGNNQAAVQGFEQVRNPFTTDASGRLNLRTNADGSLATPSLAFWDAVKQKLDSINTRESQFLARTLRDHLDTLVPEYRTARAGAAAAFGAQDALEAGQMFASSSMPIKEARIAYQRLSNAERQLFANGFASDLLDKIAKSGDRRNIINSIFASEDSRQRLIMALGPQGFRRIEAAARVENVMDMLRTATQGNSKTAQYLMDLGVAGGTAGAGWFGGFDPTTTSASALAAVLVRRGRGAVDQRVVQRVGEMLASNDPQVLRNAYDTISRNRGFMEAIRRAENDLSRISAPVQPQVTLPNILPAAAEQDQNNRPR